MNQRRLMSGANKMKFFVVVPSSLLPGRLVLRWPRILTLLLHNSGGLLHSVLNDMRLLDNLFVVHLGWLVLCFHLLLLLQLHLLTALLQLIQMVHPLLGLRLHLHDILIHELDILPGTLYLLCIYLTTFVSIAAATFQTGQIG